MPALRRGGRELAYRDDGDGEAILLIPGLGGAMAFWNAVWPRFTARHRVISFDHPGMGDSDATPGPPTVEALASLVITLLDTLAIERASVVGHSLGGAVAQTLAIDCPQRLNRLVLSSTWARPDHYFRKAFEQRKAILEFGGATAYARAQTLSVLPPEWIAANPRDADAQEQRAAGNLRDPAVLSARIDHLLAFDRSTELARITIPTLVVYCEGDAVVPPHMSRDLAGRLRSPSVAELAGGGHFAPMLKPAEFAAAVLAFIDGRVDAARSGT